MTSPPIDPYFTPTPSPKTATWPVGPPRPRPLAAWLILFGLNLPIPAVLATLVLLPAGWAGLAVAVAGWAGVGVLFLRRFPGLIASARKGAGMVGLLQPIMVVHIPAGRAAVTLTWRVLGGDDRLGLMMPRSLGFAGGFLATAITGAELLAASLLVGLPIQALVVAWKRRTAADLPRKVHN